jgi:predicted TIM-barrel fold metal-dependent hydrolase
MYSMISASSKNWVDSHFHVFHAGEALAGARYVPHYSATLPDWQAQAAQVGVRRGVCVQPSFLGTDNHLMLQALQAHPELLRGVAVVAADTPPAVLRDMHASGVRGIRLNLSGVSHAIPQWTGADALWQTLHELGWHLEVHTDPGCLPQVLTQLPTEIPLVADHMAKPAQDRASDASIQALVRRAANMPTYVKLSGAYRLGTVDAAALAHLWCQALGAQALLWGSDWPCTNHEHLANYETLFAAVETWVGPEHGDQVLRQNPERLYGFQAS